jgi:anti-anti-sigma factor
MSVVRVEGGSGGRFVAASGDLDLTVAGDLDSALGQVAESTSVVVDLSDATLVDSRAIGVLLAWSERLRARGERLAIVTSDPDILRLFTTIGLDREFDFHPTREAAFPAVAEEGRGSSNGDAGR